MSLEEEERREIVEECGEDGLQRIEEAIKVLLAMPYEERRKVFGQFCTSCGRDDPFCDWCNDE